MGKGFKTIKLRICSKLYIQLRDINFQLVCMFLYANQNPLRIGFMKIIITYLTRPIWIYL